MVLQADRLRQDQIHGERMIIISLYWIILTILCSQ